MLDQANGFGGLKAGQHHIKSHFKEEEKNVRQHKIGRLKSIAKKTRKIFLHNTECNNNIP